MIYKMTLSVCA